jgi:hypothetical protein
MNTEHGKCLIAIDGNIIKSKTIGSFNIEGLDKAIESLKLAIDSFCQKDFKLLIDYTEAEGGTPEVYIKINEFNVWLNKQNIIAKAIVTPSSVMAEILMVRTPARKLLNEKVFSAEANALTWLKSQS